MRLPVVPCGNSNYRHTLQRAARRRLRSAAEAGPARPAPVIYLDLHQVAEIWRHGSVVRYWLLDLASNALESSRNAAFVATERRKHAIVEALFGGASDAPAARLGPSAP